MPHLYSVLPYHILHTHEISCVFREFDCTFSYKTVTHNTHIVVISKGVTFLFMVDILQTVLLLHEDDKYILFLNPAIKQ